jgi:hypothetical protein
MNRGECIARWSAGVVLAVVTTAASGRAQQVPAAPPGPPGGGRMVFTEPAPFDFNDHTDYVSLFDGVSLKGWDGNPKFWRVEDGAIVGESTPTNPAATATSRSRRRQGSRCGTSGSGRSIEEAGGHRKTLFSDRPGPASRSRYAIRSSVESDAWM